MSSGQAATVRHSNVGAFVQRCPKAPDVLGAHVEIFATYTSRIRQSFTSGLAALDLGPSSEVAWIIGPYDLVPRSAQPLAS